MQTLKDQMSKRYRKCNFGSLVSNLFEEGVVRTLVLTVFTNGLEITSVSVGISSRSSIFACLDVEWDKFQRLHLLK